MYAGDWRMKAEGVSKVCFGDASVYRNLQACSQVFYVFFAGFMLTCLRVHCEC